MKKLLAVQTPADPKGGIEMGLFRKSLRCHQKGAPRKLGAGRFSDRRFGDQGDLSPLFSCRKSDPQPGSPAPDNQDFGFDDFHEILFPIFYFLKLAAQGFLYQKKKWKANEKRFAFCTLDFSFCITQLNYHFLDSPNLFQYYATILSQRRDFHGSFLQKSLTPSFPEPRIGSGAGAGIQNCLNPAPSGTGFRVALRLPGMTTSSCFQEFCKSLGFIFFVVCEEFWAKEALSWKRS
jgi:hypothetical protein